MPIASEKLSHYVSPPSLLLAFPSFFFHPSKLRGPPPLFRHASDRPSAPALPPPPPPSPPPSLPPTNGEKEKREPILRRPVTKSSRRRVEKKLRGDEKFKDVDGKKNIRIRRSLDGFVSVACGDGGGDPKPTNFFPPDRARSEISSP